MNYRIKDITYRILILIVILALASCREKSDEPGDCVEMSNISARMTRAGQVNDKEPYVGKDEFDDQDRIVFVTIKRTEHPISQFTYSNLEFVSSVSTEQGVTSIGWSRDKSKGTTAEASAGEAHPDRIYWSDATSPHTFTGFCTPQQGQGNTPFDWTEDSNHTAYYGSIGDPTLTGGVNDSIDYRSTFDNDGNETLSGNVELRKNDILLTHSTVITAQDAIAKLDFYHGLAQVRVIVNISDFAAGGGDDTKSKVSDMVLKDMLTMYKWYKNSVTTQQLDPVDQTVLNNIYSSYTPTYNQKKNFNLWIPKPAGVGENSSRTFTFYGMVVPEPESNFTEDFPLNLSFKVTYPDPMKPTEMKTHTYNASISNIRFSAGKCTTISISLNHKNEKMTVGAEYDDWDFVQTPDQGELKKNSTFLSSTTRTADSEGKYNVTILGDPNATVDDATWLYVDATDGNKIKDTYGNDGSEAKPFQISTADQLLSFAYEVKGTNRTAVTPKKQDGTTDLPISGSFDFTGYYVTLDAGITLQPTEKATKKELDQKKADQEAINAAPDELSWIGVGETGKPFNGTFLGGGRHISRLYDSPFFVELGAQAHVDQVVLGNVIEIHGNGGFADINQGIICGCEVEGNVLEETNTNPVGSFVGTNSGLIFACYHVGDLTVKGASVVGGLVGKNETGGKIVASYNYGKITASGTNKYGVLGANNAGVSVFGCFYDNTKASNVSNVAPNGSMDQDYPSKSKTTIEMIRRAFTGEASDLVIRDSENNLTTYNLNAIINSWVEANRNTLGEDLANHLKSHYYVPQPANYPRVY